MEADEYIRRGSRKITGWLSRESADLMKVVSDAQVAFGTRGSVGEIGVLHGKLFLLLYLLAQPGERAFAIDVFEAQHLNPDQSGEGDREIFETNLQAIHADFGRIDVIADSSLNVNPKDLLRLTGPSRLFSVDGGHTTDVATNDLLLAEATLSDGGVVVLDDAFQSLYPGVATALAMYLLGSSRLVPFVVSPEKVLLTQAEHHDRLMAAVLSGMGDQCLRVADYFGYPVAVIMGHPRRTARIQRDFAKLNVYKQLREAPVTGPAIEKLRPSVLKLMEWAGR